MISKPAFSVLAILIALTAFPGPVPAAAPVPSQDNAATTFLIELRIYELLNVEREKRGLSRLELSPDLSGLARDHSRDMAGAGRLSHIASSGRSFGERLTDGGFFFEEAGENVAFSETFVAEFIHKALMDSSDHRGEILRPEYDRVGIGVVQAPGRGYYLTEDFVRSIIPVSASEAERNLKQQIDQARTRKGLTPLVFGAETDEAARAYSRMKAGLKGLPPSAKLLGEVTVDFTTSGSLDLDAIRLSGTLSPDVEDAGLGVWFGRDPGHPGGAYFITLLAVPTDPYQRASRDDLRKTVLSAINGIRRRANLPLLSLDSFASKVADRTSQDMMLGRRPSPSLSSSAQDDAKPPSMSVYVTEDPARLPQKIEPDLLRIRNGRIAIGIAHRTTENQPRGTYWVTLIFH
jgi:uncharacterized protein YkwD